MKTVAQLVESLCCKKEGRRLDLNMIIEMFQQNKTNSVASVHERTVPTEQPLLVGEVSSKFCG
jgi:hypothetical protein